MNKSVLLIPLGLIVLEGCSVEEKPVDKPNILFIMSDDHACKAISAYG